MTRFLSIILILYSQYINLQWAHIHTAATVLRAALIGSHCRVACWDHSRPITYNISEKNLTFKWVRYILELSSYTSHVILVMRHRIEYQECLSVGSYLKLLGQVWCVYILGKGTCKRNRNQSHRRLSVSLCDLLLVWYKFCTHVQTGNAKKPR